MARKQLKDSNGIAFYPYTEEPTYVPNKGILMFGNNDNVDEWYAIQDGVTYGTIKSNSNKWDFVGVYSTALGSGSNLYFVYKGENYYATEIRDKVLSPLSKTGNPISVSMGSLCEAYIIKDENDNFSVYFELD